MNRSPMRLLCLTGKQRLHSPLFAPVTKPLLLVVTLVCLFEQLSAAKIVKRQDKKEEFVCPADGKWPHESNCGKYYQCR